MSHATQARPALEPIRKTLMVQRPASATFRRFTEGLSGWWPLRSHSVSGERALACELEGRVGGSIFETRDDGARLPWGRVLVWDPPQRIVFTWHPGRAEDSSHQVEIRFSPEGNATRVELEHRGWEALGEIAGRSREGYDTGWDTVLGRHFAAACGV